MPLEVGDEVESRETVWMTIVEPSERFTNLKEYNARFSQGDPDTDLVTGRSTNPLDADTDDDGLLDGIEVLGWTILVVNNGVNGCMSPPTQRCMTRMRTVCLISENMPGLCA